MAPARDVTRGRHFTYKPDSNSGMGYPVYPTDPVFPVFAPLQGDYCKQDPIEIPAARHFTYTSGGIPVVAVPIQCCDAIGDMQVDDSCWSGGITDHVIARLFNVNNCRSAWNKKIELLWVDDPPSSGYWAGNSDIQSGQNLSFKFWCDSYEADNSPSKFVLGYQGCASGIVTAGYDCGNPLRINFGQFTASGCCDCSYTSEDAQINVYLEANCPETVFARHGGYTSGDIPVFYQPTACHQYGGDTGGCAQMSCAITATITSITGCSCLEGTYTLPYGGYLPGGWGYDNVGSCTSFGILTVTCTNLTDPNGFPTGYVRLFAFFLCGVTDTGSGYVDVTYDELEDLDATIEMDIFDPVEDPPPCCNGTISIRLMR